MLPSTILQKRQLMAHPVYRMGVSSGPVTSKHDQHFNARGIFLGCINMFASRSRENCRVSAHSFPACNVSARKEDIMSSRTIFLSRLIGLFLILVVLSLAVHKQATVDLLTGLFHSPEMMFVLSITTLAAGLAMVLAHNIWSGAQAVVVTLVGWLTLIKGLLYLLQFHEMVGECILSWLHHPLGFYLWLTPSLLIGIYLTYEGFRS